MTPNDLGDTPEISSDLPEATGDPPKAPDNLHEVKNAHYKAQSDPYIVPMVSMTSKVELSGDP